jgi:hypothetical protein
LFTIYTLIDHSGLFDVFLSASPDLIWKNEYIFSKLGPLKSGPSNGTHNNSTTKPAFQLSYGAYEQVVQKRRRETQEECERRKAFLSSLKTADLCQRLYAEVKESSALRDAELVVYPFSYHEATAASALNDGIDYFLDW